MPRRVKLFEFSVAVVVIGAVAWFLQAELLRIEEDAERLMVETTIRNVNTGVRFAQAQLIVQGRESEIPGLFSGSPLRWLETPPADFVERDQIGAEDLAPGRWVWERRSGVLHYTPRLRAGLVISGGNDLQWQWVAAGGTSGRTGLQAAKLYRWVLE